MKYMNGFDFKPQINIVPEREKGHFRRGHKVPNFFSQAINKIICPYLDNVYNDNFLVQEIKAKITNHVLLPSMEYSKFRHTPTDFLKGPKFSKR